MKPVTFTITGQPSVKKNNQKVGYNRTLGRVIKYNTPSYKEWHRTALRQLHDLGYNIHFKKQQKLDKTLKAEIDQPVNLKVLFFINANRRVDLSGLYEGIQDVLVEVGLLQDDNWHIVTGHDGSRVEVDRENPRMEITITPRAE